MANASKCALGRGGRADILERLSLKFNDDLANKTFEIKKTNKKSNHLLISLKCFLLVLEHRNEFKIRINTRMRIY